MNHFFSHWNILDFVLAIVFLFSVILSFFRGFVCEAISLITWFLAFYLALQFSPAFAGTLHSFISNPKAAYIVAFIIIFIIVMILGGIVKKLASGLVKLSFLGFFDKIFGFVFGVVRGILFIAIILFIIQLTPFHDSTWMKTSQLVPHFHGLIAYFDKLIPKQILNLPTTIKAQVSSLGNALMSHVKN
jgi:membrane protein required for colicin V production